LGATRAALDHHLERSQGSAVRTLRIAGDRQIARRGSQRGGDAVDRRVVDAAVRTFVRTAQQIYLDQLNKARTERR
jgi:hypothetical protein